MLTRKQHELLRFIHERLRETGVPPSFDEMKDALDLKSKSGVHRLISALEERGFIRRLPNRARALEVIRLPESTAGVAPRGRFQPSVVEGGLARAKAPAPPPPAQDERRSMAIPVMGRIAAGTPVSAIQNPSHSITVSPEFLGGGEHYALEVRGDSMIDAGIFDGDFAIVRQQPTARTGEIVAAMIPGEFGDTEATVKTIRHRGSAVVLEPANATMEPFEAPPGTEIIGKVVAVLRKL